MARLQNNQLGGAVGNIIFYTVNGITYARTKPSAKRKKQVNTVTTQVSAFGTISKYGSPMVTALRPYVSCKIGRTVYCKVRGWMMDQWQRNGNASFGPIAMQGTAICQLNQKVDLRDCLLQLPTLETVEEGLKFTFPPLVPFADIVAPKGTMRLDIKMLAITSSFTDSASLVNVVEAVCTIPFNKQLQPAASFVLPIQQTGVTVAVCLAMDYFMEGGNNIVSNPL